MSEGKKLGIIALTGAESAGLAIVFRYFFCRLRVFDPVYETLYLRPAPFWIAGIFFAAAFFLFFAGCGWEERSKRAVDYISLIFAGIILLPDLDSVLPLLISFGLIAWGLFRHGYRLGGEECNSTRLKFLTPQTGGLLALLLGFAGVCFSYYLQKTAYNTLFLLFNDWGEYATHYLRLAFSPEATLRDWFVGGGHFNLLVNIIMATAIKLFPVAETIFFLNGVMIYSAIPLVYYYGRCRKLSVETSLFFAAVFCFAPIVSNQSLSLFYGFHPVNLQPSLILLFFIFKARRNFVATAVFMMLTLFVQETAA
ncbi:MAG: DUF2079 domain-containing protein, partial [Victivallales bacterium]|nr:DUF2079 domain-containing protein [Victivallales bacterium]